MFWAKAESVLIYWPSQKQISDHCWTTLSMPRTQPRFYYGSMPSKKVQIFGTCATSKTRAQASLPLLAEPAWLFSLPSSSPRIRPRAVYAEHAGRWLARSILTGLAEVISTQGKVYTSVTGSKTSFMEHEEVFQGIGQVEGEAFGAQSNPLSSVPGLEHPTRFDR